MGGLVNKSAWTAKEVRHRLEAGEELSTFGQTLDAGGWRLAASVNYLKKKFKLPIASYTRKGFGRCAFYRLLPCLYQSVQVDIFEQGGGNRPTQNLKDEQI
jgi:hypothetical protein